MSQETLEVIRRGYDLWNSGRIDDWAEMFHPEIEFRPSGAMPGLQPVYRAPDTKPVGDDQSGLSESPPAAR